MTSLVASFLPYAIHGGLALVVTNHALVHGRDTGTRIAWIGLAWLSPYLGSLLYFLLGINRVRRRATSLRGCRSNSQQRVTIQHRRRDDHLAALDHAGQRITNRALKAGNLVTILRNGDVAYPEMLRAINSARLSIGLSTYIFRADTVGLEFIDALARARARGVEVRVIIDGVGGGYWRSTAFRNLRHAGVPAARFMHSVLPWRRSFLNLRCHKKMLVVDGAIGFTGGLNIGAENQLSTHPRHGVSDTHFRFEGPVLVQLAEVFAEDWFFTTAEELVGEAWFPPLNAIGGSGARVVNSGPDDDIEKIEFMVLEAVSRAQSSIKVMTPYFLPDSRILTALRLAAFRGVAIDLVLPLQSNNPIIDWATRSQLGPLLEAGCRIWTHPLPFDHSKLMSIDGLWCFVGSANWDMRSFRLNFELNVEVFDEGVVEAVDELIAQRQTTQLTARQLNTRPWLVLIRDSGACLISPYL